MIKTQLLEDIVTVGGFLFTGGYILGKYLKSTIANIKKNSNKINKELLNKYPKELVRNVLVDIKKDFYYIFIYISDIYNKYKSNPQFADPSRAGEIKYYVINTLFNYDPNFKNIILSLEKKVYKDYK